MKQIIQRLNPKLGIKLMDLPAPKNKKGNVLIKTTKTLVSKGTESTIVEFGNASFYEKVKQRPEKIKQLIKSLKSNGLIKTFDNVKNSIDQYIALGYCNCGIVVESDVVGINVGDRVVSNGPHAEVVRVPANLVVKIPDTVSDDYAVFTVIGSIGLQGIRLFNPTYGENVIVFGLGLVGLITIQLLKANGTNVIGIDIDEKKCKIADDLGIKTLNPKIDDIESKIINQTKGVGVDGVIITAASKSDEIIAKSARLCRKRGRIVLIGVIGLNINREDFYEKELTFQVSCSYGPGRYDTKYEEEGIDYPLPYVRWTEKRNFETILESIEKGSLKIDSLITEKIMLEDYRKIYDNIDSSNSIASIIDYSNDEISRNSKNTIITLKTKSYTKNKPVVGIIGAGNFTKSVIIPTLIKLGCQIKCIASSTGVSSSYLAKKYDLSYSTTDYKNIIEDEDVNTIMITTRHDTHSKFAKEVLKANKNLFVEKPLALDNQELNNIIDIYNKSKSSSFLVGFNRRFSSHAESIKKYINDNDSPINISITINAGYVPNDNWITQRNIGGGRIIGEACHLIDLCIFFTNSEVDRVCMNSIGSSGTAGINDGSIILRFNNGSNAIINYFTNGSSLYSKERIEVYDNNRTFIIDDFNVTKAYGVKGFKSVKNINDKGHKNQFSLYLSSISNGSKNIISTKHIYNCSRTAIAATKSLMEKSWIKV